MSLTLNMVGGGGKLKGTDAVLVVTVPTGSTVTATKGGTTLTPTMWVKAADQTLDCAIFSIPASKFDSTTPWTVTATLGTDSASDNVTIDSNKQYDLEIIYQLYIIKNGLFVNGFSFPKPLRSGYTVSITQNVNGYLRVEQSTMQSQGAATNQIDLSTYSTLSVEAYSSSGISHGWVGAYASYNYGSQDALSSAGLAKTDIKSTTTVSRTIDISSINVSAYIGAAIISDNAGSSVYIKNLWLD